MGSIEGPQSSLFSNLPAIPPDEPFSVNAAYHKDTHPKKVNLGIGVYRTSEGNPWPLRVVEDAEKTIYETKDHGRHEYLSIQGDQGFLHLAANLVFNLDPTTTKERIASIQTVSGTGANRLGAEFLSRYINPKPQNVWIPDPTWANHHTIWQLAGTSSSSASASTPSINIKTYPYYDPSTGGFNYTETMSKLVSEAKTNDVIILHACAHNPTGADPSIEQWESIAQLCKEKNIIPFFDLAYQGFASGDVDKDGWAIRHFFQMDLEFCVAQSFSKNFGLYGQRVGALHVVTRGSSENAGVSTGHAGDTGAVNDVLATLCHLVRGEYSMAPRGGAEIVRTVLGNEGLRKKWVEDLQMMSTRILGMRRALYEELLRLGTPGDWTHILKQIGMFTYVGLSESQARAIRERHHIYMLKSGRISISGLNESNVRHVAMGIDDVVRTVF